jgi:hypothetical protein
MIDTIFQAPDRTTPFSIERISLGRVGAQSADLDDFAHDASTLGGNSGSIVFDIRTRTIVGLHCGGYKADGGEVGYNEAVGSSVIAVAIQEH